MKSFILLLAMLCFVNGRNLHDLDEDRNVEVNEDAHLVKSNRDASQMRHRRKSRQSFIDYSPYYSAYDNRRDYDRHQDNQINQIFRLLDELTFYARRPQPQPQIVYVPYPVPYPQPQCTCAKPFTPNFTTKWPDMDDTNMNWGLVPGEVDDDESDGSRPISLDGAEPDEQVPIPPPVEHGSQQAGMESKKKRLGPCHAAILVCCNKGNMQDHQKCFSTYGCLKTFNTGLACKSQTIMTVLEEFGKIYGPNSKR